MDFKLRSEWERIIAAKSHAVIIDIILSKS